MINRNTSIYFVNTCVCVNNWEIKKYCDNKRYQTMISSNDTIRIYLVSHYGYSVNTNLAIFTICPFEKLPFDCQKIFLKKMKIFANFFEKYVKFLAIFWQSNGNFPEGHVWIFLQSNHKCPSLKQTHRTQAIDINYHCTDTDTSASAHGY